MHVPLVHKYYPWRDGHFKCNMFIPKRDLVSSMLRFTPSRAIRIAAHPIVLPKSTLLRTFTSSRSEVPSMTHPAEETRSVEDLDRLLEIIRASTNGHIPLEVF